MTTPEDPSDPRPEDNVAALEKEIGIREGFFQDLLSIDDDWAFIIQIHALVEAAVSHLLVEITGQPNLLDVYSRLELSNTRTGKMAFTKALDCLQSDERRTIRKLSELRNQLVHDVSNVDFDLSNWVQSLDTNQLAGFAKAFGPPDGVIVLAEGEVPFIDVFRQQPKWSIWMACLVLLALVYDRKDLAALKRQVESRKQQLADRLIKGALFDTST